MADSAAFSRDYFESEINYAPNYVGNVINRGEPRCGLPGGLGNRDTGDAKTIPMLTGNRERNVERSRRVETDRILRQTRGSRGDSFYEQRV